MAVGIGEQLRAERRRQGRTLADAAAETRVRESYLAAIEEEEFDALGGAVYARGFIKLYGRYLDLDAEALVEQFRQAHGNGGPVSAMPSNSVDDILPPPSRPGLRVSPPVLAAVGLVALLVVLFVFFRATTGGPAEEASEDPNAPGPSPAEVADQPAVVDTEDPEQVLADTPADPLVDGPGPAQPDAPVLEELIIDVDVLREVRLNVVRGQPPVNNALLGEGDFRQLTGDPAVIFQLSDAGAVDISVNGLPLVGLGGPGQAVQVSCIIGRPGCDVVVL